MLNKLSGLKKYTKSIVAVVIAGLYAVQAALTDDTITSAEWHTIALAVVTAIGVYLFPNKSSDTPE